MVSSREKIGKVTRMATGSFREAWPSPLVCVCDEWRAQTLRIDLVPQPRLNRAKDTALLRRYGSIGLR